MSASRTITSAHHDYLTGFGDHDKLVTDLTEALTPGSPQAVLAVFELAGSSDYRQVYGELASAELIVRCAARFRRVIEPAGVCYRPRQDEFCALISGPIDKARATLYAAAHSIRGGKQPFLVSARLGAAVLPDEADDPIDLLILADERLQLLIKGGKPRSVGATPGQRIRQLKLNRSYRREHLHHR
jgi:GGDEF domain-containing protein